MAFLKNRYFYDINNYPENLKEKVIQNEKTLKDFEKEIIQDYSKLQPMIEYIDNINRHI